MHEVLQLCEAQGRVGGARQVPGIRHPIGPEQIWSCALTPLPLAEAPASCPQKDSLTQGTTEPEVTGPR